MSKPKIAVVTWIDAWYSDSLSADVNMLRETCGFLVANNKRIVRIALTIDERGPSDLMNIPKAYVRSVKILDAKHLRDEVESDAAEPSEDDMIQAQRGY